jgi:hypothetical protein
MNLVMIDQTAQCWSTDGLYQKFEVGEQEFDLASENERLTVFVCYHHAVQ